MTLKYPIDIDGSCDYIRFKFFKYENPLSGVKTDSSDYKTTMTGTATGVEIAMNMPSDIGSSFSGSWSGKNTTALAQYALNQVATPVANFATDGNVKAALSKIGLFSNPGETLKGGLQALGEDGVRYLATSFAGLPGLGANLSENDVLQLSVGTILNPNTELLYGGNSLRTHSYSFKMIPQTQGEAKQVLDIVKEFQKACLPELKSSVLGTKGRNFITIPDLCEVKFMGKDYPSGSNPYLPSYKLSGITSVNVGYVTDGNYMSFSDGRPIGINLTVSLTETKLIFRDEIGTYR